MSRLDLLQQLVVDTASSVPLDQQYTAMLRVDTPMADDELQVGVKELNGEHPLTELMGFVAPSDWWALGVIATGWMAPLDGGRPSAHPDAVRTAQVILVTRNGNIVSHVRAADGESFDDPPSYGRTLDALQRALGLPTPPAAGFVPDVFLVLWLQFVEAEAREARLNLQKMTWVRAARCFPFATSVRNAHVREPGAFAELLLATVDDIDWERLRLWGTRGSLGMLVKPDLAQWMDEGMFSRWIAGVLPPVHAQLERTCQRLAPEVSSRVREAVDAVLLGAAARAA